MIDKFQKGFVILSEHKFPCLLALTAEEQERGLMFVPPEPPIVAFAYPSARVNKFWMKNTPSPLDIIFILDGKISQMHFGEPFSTKIIGNDQESDLIVEFPSGYVDKYNLKIGDPISLDSESIKKIYNK